MSNIDKITVSQENSDALRIKEEFNDRWNLKEIKQENFQKAKIRCLMVLENTFNSILYDARKKVIYLCSIKVSTVLGENLQDDSCGFFENSKIYNYINRLDADKSKNDYHYFMLIIEVILNCDVRGYINKDSLAKDIVEAFELSYIKASICKNEGKYRIYPSDIEFLDTPLVLDVLSWLNEYPDVRNTYEKAIIKERKTENYRYIIDDLRLSVELFFKKTFNNEKSLENQDSNIGKYFLDNNVATQISNMYMKLLDYYEKYNNNNVKHNENIAAVEIDYMIYLTGSFMRFILLIERNKTKI